MRQRWRLFGMCVQQRFDRKDVVRIGVFQRCMDCIGGPLLSPMSPASGGEHALRRGNPFAQKALSKPHTASEV